MWPGVVHQSIALRAPSPSRPYCCSVEVDHERGLPFNQRAHLMSAAILADHSFIPWVGCCCNEDVRRPTTTTLSPRVYKPG